MKESIKKFHKNLVASIDNFIESITCLKRFLEITKIRDNREKRSKLRTIFINTKRPHDYEGTEPLLYCDNEIVTSKYTFLTFFPKNMYEQFRRIANFYFAINAIIMFIIPDPPFDPYSNAFPFLLVIIVTALKQAYEDVLRHRADRKVNQKKVRVLREGQFIKIKSKEIMCGDVVEVERDSHFPCDMILVYSSAETETCHIQTANLDGETNLKIRYIPNKFPRVNTIEELGSIIGVINCEKPNTRLYEFRGKITLADGNEVALSNNNILLRGQNLKIAPIIYGCAIYTGANTKVMLNSKFKANKLSSVERRLNVFVLVFIIILTLLTLGCLVGSIYFEENGIYTKHWYMRDRQPIFFFSNLALNRFITFIFYMNINYLVPLSMYVTIELQRFLGSEFFEWDMEMYDEVSNEPAKVNSSDLNEDLGQIEYLFSDKTGTLTENEMVFKHFGLDGITYEERNGQIYKLDSDEPIDIHNNEQITRLIEGLCLCHTVQYDTSSKDIYNASSPDELSFINFCLKLGIVFDGDVVERDKDKVYRKITYSINGYLLQKKYELIEILDFDSSRKRMSVIIKHSDSNSYILYSKGADTAMFKKSTITNHDSFEISLKEYSQQGWRTLVFGYKILTTEQFKIYSDALSDARNDVLKREQRLNAAFDMIESNLILNGVTAVEDKLQDDVADTISSLREAGIKIWVLTGDKLETAVNISESCKHFSNTMIKFSLSDMSSSNDLKENLRNIRHEIKKNSKIESFALVVDGETLGFIFDMNFQDSFREISERCDAVLCCRMSPKQKAEIVKLIKSSKAKPMTAAIGDGANDVSMIQEAHVGIGIFGKEGRSAALSADFAFAKFKFLKRALLVHGYLYYTRAAILVLYFFYKNFLFIICQAYYAPFSAFSASSLYNALYQATFNLALTTVPIFVMSLVEQKTPIEKLEKYPYYYKTIARNGMLSAFEFTKWTLLGVWHSFNCFFLPFLFYWFNNANLTYQGWNEGGGQLGSLTVFLIFIIAHIKIFLIWQHQTVITLTSYIVSVICFCLCFFISNTFISVFPFVLFTEYQNLYWQSYQVLSSPQIWLLIILAVVFSLIPDIIIKVSEDMDLSKSLGPKIFTQYLKNSMKPNQIKSKEDTMLSIRTPTKDIRAPSASPSTRSTLNVKLFQSDNSVLSSNNIELTNRSNQETSSF